MEEEDKVNGKFRFSLILMYRYENVVKKRFFKQILTQHFPLAGGARQVARPSPIP